MHYPVLASAVLVLALPAATIAESFGDSENVLSMPTLQRRDALHIMHGGVKKKKGHSKIGKSKKSSNFGPKGSSTKHNDKFDLFNGASGAEYKKKAQQAKTSDNSDFAKFAAAHGAGQNAGQTAGQGRFLPFEKIQEIKHQKEQGANVGGPAGQGRFLPFEKIQEIKHQKEQGANAGGPAGQGRFLPFDKIQEIKHQQEQKQGQTGHSESGKYPSIPSDGMKNSNGGSGSGSVHGNFFGSFGSS